MAIALNDSAVTNADTAGRSSGTQSFTVTSGSNLIMIAVFHFLNGSTDPTISAADFNGDSLTFLHGQTNNYQFNRHIRTSAYYLVNPDVGTLDFSWTYGQTQAADVVSLYTLSGVDQSSPIGATNDVTGNSNTDTISLTTTAADSIVLGHYTWEGHDAQPFSTGDTELYDLQSGGNNANTDCSAFGGYEIATSIGSYGIDATASVTDDFVGIAFEIKASGGAPPTTRRVFMVS